MKEERRQERGLRNACDLFSLARIDQEWQLGKLKSKNFQRSNLAFANHDGSRNFVVQSAVLFLVENDHQETNVADHSANHVADHSNESLANSNWILSIRKCNAQLHELLTWSSSFFAYKDQLVQQRNCDHQEIRTKNDDHRKGRRFTTSTHHEYDDNNDERNHQRRKEQTIDDCCNKTHTEPCIIQCTRSGCNRRKRRLHIVWRSSGRSRWSHGRCRRRGSGS